MTPNARLKDEFELFGLVNPEKLDETVDTLYRNVYNWKQFAAYILLIILVSGIVFFGQWYSSLAASPVASIVVYGYLGAYVFSVQELIRRYNTFDLQPQVYSSILVRFLISMAITFILGSLLFSANASELNNLTSFMGEQGSELPAPTGSLTSTVSLSNTQAITTTAAASINRLFPVPVGRADPLPTWMIIVAFTIGIFPTLGIRWFVLQANRLLNPPISQESELSLRNLLGVSTWHEARLSMMGIDDAQNLATVDIPRLLLTTQFDTQQVANWIDQAILYVKVGSRINRFREAKITTFHEFLQTMQKLGARPQLLDSLNGFVNASDNGPPPPPEPMPERQLANLSIVLGLTSPDELYRLGDFSGFPNYTHITAYYEGIARVGSQRAERSVQRLTTGGVIERLSTGTSVDPVERKMLIQELERLLRQPISRFKDYRYCTKLGDIYYKLGRSIEAKTCLSEAIQLNRKASEAYYSLSLVHLSDKNYEQAIWHITQAIALSGADAELYNLRGSIYIEMKQYEQALPDLDQAIQFDRTLAVAYLK